jgi:hypothetical protein
MLIPFGVLSAAGAGGVAGSDFELISSSILGSAQSSVVFDTSSLGSTYKHLQLRFTTRGTRTEADDTFLVRFNGDTGTNYSYHRLGTFNGSTVDSAAGVSASQLQIAYGAGGNTTANAFTGAVVDILDPFSTTKNTTIRTFSGIAASITYLNLQSGVYRNTAAITSITLFPISANLIAGSRFSLYGIKG